MIKIYEGVGEEIIPLFNSVTPELEVDIKKWRWKYIENPLKENLIAVFETDKGEIVGEEAIVPFKAYFKGKIVKIGHSVDSMVLENFRGRGIFKRLAIKTLEEGKTRGYYYFYGFPNKNSLPIYTKKLGWISFGYIRRWIFPLNLNILSTKFKIDLSILSSLFKFNKSLLKRKFNFIKVQNFSGVEKYLDNLKNHYDIFLLRDEEFLTWRYLSHPYYIYEIFKDDDSLFILRIKEVDIKRGTIEEFLYKNYESFSKLVSFSLRFFIENNVDLVDIWIKQGDPLERILFFKGFIPYQKRLIILYPFEKIHFSKNYFFNFSDLDVI
ncbi:MAG: GNAT family N-acetyltransferase [Caldisericia bacterium]|jgi:predicted acetyltransferase|nr:GNAT family N-acetyltransferase [Caldisericia bacterium]